MPQIFIVGAPGFFPTVWGWIKRWFDPITVSKIFILSPANVYPTLLQYIDHDNIPKKYGGGLDFEWGSMPNIEPTIDGQLKWENPSTQNGRKTLPIGPIKWEEGLNGEMQAWGVGSENGAPRRKLIFTIPNPVGYKKGDMPAPNTPAFQIGDPLTTVGTATQPPDSAVDEANLDTPPSDSGSSDSASVAAPAAPSAAMPAASNLPIRAGTSDTRYEQQDQTHAAGQLAQATPDVNHHGHGDKTVTMEPNTVGQAQKEIPLPEPEQPAAPGYLEQAQNAAASASAAVSSTVGGIVSSLPVVGGGGKKEEGKEEGKEEEPVVRAKSPQEEEVDRKIDATKDTSVEAFLREQSRSGKS
ncbi:hypothetical protein N0V83_008523 [Neocucurbitaria cava]|uniref:CRAL-TRIO domain-containing protein n=1 Tax=Neocucurbitaria cava TaxID=798079 RepID=A0A9W9CJM8_9PLEO|nr:hypothetical protein N0V83_008523 [Neocucurbitaria cava]